MKPLNFTVTRHIQWHGMICPACLDDQNLIVTFSGSAHITNSGSVDEGDHEWNKDSHCRCECGFEGPVLAFEAGVDDAEISFNVHCTNIDDPEIDPVRDADLHDLDFRPVFDIVTDADEKGINTRLVRTIGDWTHVLKTVCAKSRIEAARNILTMHETYESLVE